MCINDYHGLHLTMLSLTIYLYKGKIIKIYNGVRASVRAVEDLKCTLYDTGCIHYLSINIRCSYWLKKTWTDV